MGDLVQLNHQWVSIPTPTVANWDAQIRWAFEEVASRSDIGHRTVSNYTQVGRAYCRYIEETIGKDPYFIGHEWDSFCLMHYRDYLLQKLSDESYSPRTVVHLYNTVSKVILGVHMWGITKKLPLKIELPRTIKHGKCVSDFTKAFDACGFRSHPATDSAAKWATRSGPNWASHSAVKWATDSDPNWTTFS